MCGPPALAAVAAGVSAAGSIFGGVMAQKQANYRAQVAERNAALERDAIRLEQEATRTEALAQYRQIAQVKGAQRAAAGGSSVSVDFGTANDNVLDTDMLGREDVARIYGQGHEKVKGRDRQVSNYKGEASAQRSAGKAALVSGFFEAGSTLLGGVSQYKKLKKDGY